MEDKCNTNNLTQDLKSEQTIVIPKQDVETKIDSIKDLEKFSQNNVSHLDVVNKLKELQGDNKND